MSSTLGEREGEERPVSAFPEGFALGTADLERGHDDCQLWVAQVFRGQRENGVVESV